MSVDKEVAISKSTQYFGGNEMAASIWVDKYALRDAANGLLEDNPDQMHRRLAKAFADVEKLYKNPLSEDEIYELFKDFKYIIPQGSPMSCIGDSQRYQSLSNCFVVESPEDSYGGICKTDQELAQIMKRRGGVGVDVSTIRPKGMPTTNAARTTDGIVVFMRRFSNTCREVAQGGRRGALMLTCNVHHPDIVEFINSKRDKTAITGANISVMFTGEFMLAVKYDMEYTQRWPLTGEAKFTRKVKARSVWNEFIKATHETAEPGALFIDTIHNGPADAYAPSVSTNPCQPAWAPVLTPSGIKQLGDISVGDEIWSGSSWTKVINKWCTGEKPVYGFVTRAGTFYGTEQHRIVSHGQKVEVGSATSIDCSVGLPPVHQRDPKLVMDGLVLGDGMYHKASNLVVLCVGVHDGDYHTSEIAPLLIEPRPGVNLTAWAVSTNIKHLPRTYEREVPDHIMYGDATAVCSFLRGLFSANGTVVGNRVQLKTSSKKLLRQVQALLSSIGIVSYYTTNKAHTVEFDNGVYECKESYDLAIGTKAGRRVFAACIGFIQDYKTKKLEKSLEVPNGKVKTNYEIIESEYFGVEPVYDITVDDPAHTYWSNGLLVSNCGEIPLCPYDSCRLMVLNALSFVSNPFTPRAGFDFEKFSSVVFKAQRLMDDLVDLEIAAVGRILKKIEADPEDWSTKKVEYELWQKVQLAARKLRRTGLGLTAIADCLAALGIRYGSARSIEFVNGLYKKLAKSSWCSSIQLAQERGAFVDYRTGKDNTYANNLISELPEYYRQLHDKHGRRNAAITTTAPAGTISNLACVDSVSRLFGTSSGIEPVFQLSYTRRKKITGTDNLSVDFVDKNGDKWHHFEVLHTARQYEKNIGYNGETAYTGSTANDIHWLEGVQLQAAAQEWVDHAISRTANIPADTTIEAVAEMYMSAWEHGLKGFTIYRDGCRDGVLITKPEAKATFQQHTAPKRPTDLTCDIYHVQINKEPWVVFVGLLEGKPYEIMAGTKEAIGLGKSTGGKDAGVIRKNSHGKQNATYSLLDSAGGCIIPDISAACGSPLHAAFSRTISLSLRHGADVSFLVEQLVKGAKEESSMQAYSKVVARVLKSYIPNNTKSTEKQCPQCSCDNLVFMEGCVTCTACGYSKCS